MAEYILSQEILKLSNSKTWEEAKKEWTLIGIYKAEKPQTCLCSHYPIIELCLIKNKFNSNETIVGNCCVNKFMEIKSNKLFSCAKRVEKNVFKSFNIELINIVFREGIINQWEKDFYTNVWRKNILSQKQMEIKIGINKKILSKYFGWKK
jgi:hypothetical protein